VAHSAKRLNYVQASRRRNELLRQYEQSKDPKEKVKLLKSAYVLTQKITRIDRKLNLAKREKQIDQCVREITLSSDYNEKD